MSTPTIHTSADLGKLIAQTHGWPAAKAFKAYALRDADRLTLSQAAVDLLKLFPPMPEASALMSAALAVTLEKRLGAPVQVIAGTLSVEGIPTLAPSQSAPSGHIWLMLGATVVDVALFRIAYSREAPARLAKHIDLTFGPNQALYVAPWRQTAKHGLTYAPVRALPAEEVTSLMAAAYHAIKQAQG
jgi:hypothetical protein